MNSLTNCSGAQTSQIMLSLSIFFLISPFLFTSSIHAVELPKCGISAVSIARIIGGDHAKPHQFPWMAYLKANHTESKHCGGVLIDAQWILTAAHCFVDNFLNKKNNNTIVLLGAHNVTDQAESRLEIDTTKVIQHDKFDNLHLSGSHANDIALVKLPVPLNFTLTGPRIRPICMPVLGEMISKTDCQIVGWGRANLTTGSIIDSPDLRSATVTLLNNQVCQKEFEHDDFVDESKVCFGGSGKNACFGDAGGPVQCRNEAGHLVAVGVVSFGYSDCNPNKPEVATHVLKYVNWINKIRAEH